MNVNRPITLCGCWHHVYTVVVVAAAAGGGDGGHDDDALLPPLCGRVVGSRVSNWRDASEHGVNACQGRVQATAHKRRRVS